MFSAPERAAKYLSKHPEQVRLLTDYWINTQRLLNLNVVFLPMEQRVVVGAQTERAAAGLLTNDSIVVAAMREYGISFLATHGKAVNATAGISIFAPADVT